MHMWFVVTCWIYFLPALLLALGAAFDDDLTPKQRRGRLVVAVIWPAFLVLLVLFIAMLWVGLTGMGFLFPEEMKGEVSK